jgi:hypothetical protein
MKCGVIFSAPRGTPLPNLPLTLIDRFGLPVEQFGEQQ